MEGLRALPAAMAKMSNQVDQNARDHESTAASIEKLREDLSVRDRRLHERIDDVLDKFSDRDREYRRNIVLALGPIAVAALLIAAKVAFGLDLPGGG